MTLSWNSRGDFDSVTDRLEAVTLTAPGGAETAVTGALRRQVSQREAAASQGRYTRRDVRWSLPQSEVAASPELGAVITDGQGETWTVLEVDDQSGGDRWRCWSRSLTIASNLTDRVDIQQAAWTQDEHGAWRAAWSDFKTGLAARIQPLEDRIEVTQGRRRIQATHIVYLETDVALTESHRIRHPTSGQSYQVVRSESKERIDALQEVFVFKTS